MQEERSRFGVKNLLAAAALLGYGWFAAAYGPDGSFPGSDFGSLAYGLSRQGLWFIPVGILIPLVLPRVRGVITGFFLVLLPFARDRSRAHRPGGGRSGRRSRGGCSKASQSRTWRRSSRR